MEIKRLHIEGFGAFRDFSIGPLPGGLVIFSGRNEAGKSTLLAFVNSMLFGFPDARTGQRLFLPMHRGSYGGRIVLSTQRYGEITIERLKSSRKASLRLYGPDGAPLDEMVLQGIFGGVTRQLFQNVYSFSLKELQSLDSLRREEIRDAIYGAGYGTSFLAVPQTIKQLRKEKDSLFRPAGRKQAINKLLFQLKEVNARLKKARKEIDHYEQLIQSLKDTRGQLSQLRQQMELESQALNKVQAAVESWQQWLRLTSIQARLSEIDKDERIKGLSVHMSFQVEEAEEKLQGLAAELGDIQEKMADIRAKLDTLRPDYGLLDKKDAISAILLSRDKFLTLQELSQGLKGEIESIDREIDSVMEQLGPSWTAERIKRTSFSAADRRRIEGFQARLDEITTRSKRLEDRLSIRLQDQKGLKSQQEQIVARLRGLKDELSGIDAKTLNELSAKEERLRELVRETERLEQAVSDRSKVVGAAIHEVFSGGSTQFLQDFDVMALTKEASLFHEELMESAQELKAAKAHLDALLARKEEMKAQIDSRQAAMSEIDTASSILADQPAIGRACFLARSLAGRQGEELGVETELLRCEEELKECARLADAKKREKEQIEKAHTTAFLVAGAFLFTVAVCLLIYLERPIFLWAVAVVGAISSLLAVPILRKRSEARRNILEAEIKRLLLKSQQLEAQRERLIQFLEAIDVDRAELSDIIGMDREEVRRDLSRILKELEDLASLMAKRETILSQVSVIRQDMDILSERISQARERLLHLQEVEKEQKLWWKSFIERYRLPQGTGCEDIALIARKIARLQESVTDIKEMEKELACKRAELEKLAVSFMDKALIKNENGQPKFTQKAVEELTLRLHDLQLLAKEQEELRRQQQEKGSELNALEEEVKEIHAGLNDLEKERQNVLSKWQSWLMEKGLEQDLDPAGAIEEIQLLDWARQIFSKREGKKAELKGLLLEISAITDKVTHLFSKIGASGTDSMDVVSMIDLLSQRLSDEVKKETDYRLLSQKMGQLAEQEARITGQISHLEKKVEKVLQKAGCDTKKELMDLLETFREREQLLSERAELVARLKAISGAEDIQAIHSFFGQKSHSELVMEAEKHAAALRDLDEQMQALVEKQAEMNLALDELISSDEHMELLARRSCLVQEVKELARRWSVLSLSLHILEQAKQRFERENQPRVIKEASRFFSTITSGRYSNIAVGAGSDDIWAVTSRGERLEPQRLSTGTAEQLYLCLRFGVISACDTGSENLPVLMDDILVNFDPERTRQAARAIGQLCGERQVLFFTCHPHIAQVLKEENPGAELIEMEKDVLPPP